MWEVVNSVRCSVDGWDFKQYVFAILFYKYLSDHISFYFNHNEHEAGNIDFNYLQISDDLALRDFKANTIDQIGYFILPSQLYKNVIKTLDDDIVERIKTIFRSIEDSSLGYRSESIISDLFKEVNLEGNRLGSTEKDRAKNLSELLRSIDEINIEDYQVDVLGNIFQFLMLNYSSKAGKLGGQFYTPSTVSKLLAKLAILDNNEIEKVYDPTCGSGSLLIEAKKLLDDDYITFYGQQINSTSYILAKMNMLIHNVNYTKFNILNGDTLTNPLHIEDKPFDLIVSNPPFSIKWDGDSNSDLINDQRYRVVNKLAPKSKADYAFILHSLYHLSDKGKAGIICFPGILYRSGAEATIRKYLIENNYIDAIIELPDNMFYNTSISTCIMILNKNKSDKNILFINANSEYIKEGLFNVLSDKNIDNILELYKNRVDVEYKAKLVSINDFNKNNNLSVSFHIEKEDLRAKIDINQINKEIDEIVERQEKLRASINELIKSFGDDNDKQFK